MSNSLQSHRLQHSRLPCPLLSPGFRSNSCPLSGWYPTISSSVIPFSSHIQSFQALGFFPITCLFASGGQSIGASASASVLSMNIQGWFPLGLTGLESPLDCKEIQPVHSEEDQPWDFFWRNNAKAETPVFWPPHATSWLIGKDSDAGRDWGQEEKGTTEDEMAEWHLWLDGRESEWTPGVGDGQGGLACCDSWGSQRVRHDWATELNWTELKLASTWGFKLQLY